MKNLDLSVIKEALDASYDLISSEYDSVCDEDLQQEYQNALTKLEDALREVEKRIEQIYKSNCQYTVTVCSPYFTVRRSMMQL